MPRHSNTHKKNDFPNNKSKEKGESSSESITIENSELDLLTKAVTSFQVEQLKVFNLIATRML